MPGDKTTYSRLRAVLEIAASRASRSAIDLAGSIVQRGPSCFAYRRWDAESEDYVFRCSEHSVRIAVALAVDLDLIGAETGQPTARGKRAADARRFDDVVQEQVAAALKAAGCPVTRLEEIAVRLLRARKPILPTADALYAAAVLQTHFEMDEHRFYTMLRLLGWTKRLSVSRRAIYVPAALA